MALDESQIEHYYREGYTLVKQLVPQEAVDKVMQKAQAQIEANIDEHLQHGGKTDGWQRRRMETVFRTDGIAECLSHSICI